MSTIDMFPPGPMFLARQEMTELTGLVQPAAQIRWLRKNGLTHYVRADGYPVVPRSEFDRRRDEGKPRVRQEPNFAALREYESRRPRKR